MPSDVSPSIRVSTKARESNGASRSDSRSLGTVPASARDSRRTAQRLRALGVKGGGSLTCATCHVMLDEPWIGRLPPAIPDERDMLDFAASPVEPGSRLSCQIQLTHALDGLVVRLPASQY